MNAPWLDRPIEKIAIASINGYQRHISPYKGFSCAHRLLHGGESCSQYVKRLIGEEGFLAAIEGSRKRFQDCREANHIFKARFNYDSNKRKSRNPCNVLDSCDCVPEIPCEPYECSDFGLDCSPKLDCGGLDCGGCSW